MNTKRILIIIAIPVSVFVILSIIFVLFSSTSRDRTDLRNAQQIEKALITYIMETKDYGLTFGEKSDEFLTVKRIILKLHDVIEIEGVEYGPYLLNSENGKTILENWGIKDKNEYNGFKITIYSQSQEIDIEPHKNEDTIIIVDKSNFPVN
ncbi:UNVERIFIED_CONTAM: hypothetical protein Cloal_1554 [Acetivibrio alkalicellulosi]